MKTRILRYGSLYESGIIYKKQMFCRKVQGCISWKKRLRSSLCEEHSILIILKFY